MPRVAPKLTVKPWGSELLFAQQSGHLGKLLRIREGEALSRQLHNHKAETFLVIKGSLLLELGELGDDKHELAPGDCWHVAPGTVHRLVARTDVECIEVAAGTDDDVVRLEDRYGRTGTTVP